MKKIFALLCATVSCFCLFAFSNTATESKDSSVSAAAAVQSVSVNFNDETAEIGSFFEDLKANSKLMHYSEYGITRADYVKKNGTMELALDPTDPTNKCLYIDNVAAERQDDLWARNFKVKNGTISCRVYLETLVDTTRISFYARSTDQLTYFKSKNIFASIVTNPKKNDPGIFTSNQFNFHQSKSFELNYTDTFDVEQFVGKWTSFKLEFSDNLLQYYINDELYLRMTIPEDNELLDVSGYFGILIFAQRMYLDDISFVSQDGYRVDCLTETESASGSPEFVGGTVERDRYTSYEGGSVTLKALPEEGFEFVGFYKDGELYSADEELAVTNLTQDLDYVAIFRPKKYLVNLFATDPADVERNYGGEVFGGNLEAETYSVLTFSYRAYDGFLFVGWYLGDELISREATYEYEVQPYEATIRAMFVPDTATLLTLNVVDQTVMTDGTKNHSGGSVKGGGEVYSGVPVKLMATVNDGFQFDGWYFNGELKSTESVYVFTADEALTVTGKFSPRKYLVQIYNDAAQTLIEKNVVYNTILHLSYGLPKAGYTFSGWICTANEYTINSDDTIDVTVQGEGVVVKAQYIQQTGKVSVKTNDSRAGKIIGSGTYGYGERVSIQVQTNEGYVLKSVTGVGTNVAYENGVLSFDMPADDVQILLEFESEISVTLSDEVAGVLFWLAIVAVFCVIVVYRLNKKKD